MSLQAQSRSLHLHQAQQRELMGAQLKETPDKSDRQIAEAFNVDHKTLGAVRKGLERGGDIPHVDDSIASLGRRQSRRKYQFIDDTLEG